MSIQSKFTDIIIDNGQTYVSAVAINDIYKMIARKSGSTQKRLINDLQLEQHIGVWRRHKDHTKVGSIATRILDQFKSQVHTLYLLVSELETPKTDETQMIHLELLKLISLLPDIKSESITGEDAEEESDLDIEPKSPTVVQETNQMLIPIIQLEEHEMFRDANDQVFPIEVRGERSKDKIRFKAKDVAAFADNDRLIEIILRDAASYQYGKDYQILQNDRSQHYCDQILQGESIPLMAESNSSENRGEDSIPLLVGSNSSKNRRGIDHDTVYLTTAGLIRVASVSRNANDNLIKLFDWLQNLFYVHQFGSYEERNELAQSLFKQVLNDKLAGLYCLSVGTFNDLYDSMDICRETYPPERYGKHQICKFGLSENIATRLTQHKNKKTGYGQWSSEVQFKWLILLSPSQLPKAEHILSNLLKAEGFTFDHSDDSKNHTELIMFDPVKEHKVKQIYRQVLDLYPSKENELSKALDDARTSFENKLNLVQANADNAIQKAQHETQLVKLSSQNEILLLKLEMANLRLASM